MKHLFLLAVLGVFPVCARAQDSFNASLRSASNMAADLKIKQMGDAVKPQTFAPTLKGLFRTYYSDGALRPADSRVDAAMMVDLLSLIVAQNQRLIEQNEQMLALMKKPKR